MKKIALIRRGRLGDLLCLYPLIVYLKEKYPNSEITVFLEKQNAPLAYYLPLIDHVVEIKKGMKYWQVLKLGFKYRGYFDIAISGKTSPMKLINLFLGALKATQSFAYVEGHWHDRFVNFPRKLQTYHEHQALKNIKVYDPEFAKPLEEYYPKLELKKPKEPRLCFLVSVSCNRFESILDLQAYAFLINKLTRMFDLTVILSALPSDASRLYKLKKLLECQAETCMTQDFNTYLQTLNRVDVALTSDGGSAHLIAALDRYLVCLFAKIDPEAWGALSKKAIHFYDFENANNINRFEIYEALQKQCQKALLKTEVLEINS